LVVLVLVASELALGCQTLLAFIVVEELG